MLQQIFSKISLLKRCSLLKFLIVWLFLISGETLAASLDSENFQRFTKAPIDIQLDGNGKNTSNSYGTYTPALYPLPTSILKTVQHYEKQSPTPHTNHSLHTSKYLLGTGIELDNRRNTAEWVATLQQGNTSPHAIKTFWLLQSQPNGVLRVLLASRAQHRLFIAKQTGAAGYRNISYRIRNSEVKINVSGRQETYQAECKKQWEFGNNRYYGLPERVDVWITDPATNQQTWVPIHEAFHGPNLTLPTACPRQ